MYIYIVCVYILTSLDKKNKRNVCKVDEFALFSEPLKISHLKKKKKCVQIQCLLLLPNLLFTTSVSGLPHTPALPSPLMQKGHDCIRFPCLSGHLTLYSSFLFDLNCEKRCCPDILPNHRVVFGLILTLFSHLNCIICDYGFLKKLN